MNILKHSDTIDLVAAISVALGEKPGQYDRHSVIWHMEEGHVCYNVRVDEIRFEGETLSDVKRWALLGIANEYGVEIEDIELDDEDDFDDDDDDDEGLVYRQSTLPRSRRVVEDESVCDKQTKSCGSDECQGECYNKPEHAEGARLIFKVK